MMNQAGYFCMCKLILICVFASRHHSWKEFEVACYKKLLLGKVSGISCFLLFHIYKNSVKLLLLLDRVSLYVYGKLEIQKKGMKNA